MSVSAVSETYRLDGVFITCIYYASAALCSYDYLLTFNEEVQYIWKSKLSFTTVFFCGFRYPVLLNTVFLILGLSSWPSWQNGYSCTIVIRFQMALYLIIMSSAALFTSLRVYAIYNRNIWFSLIVLSLTLLHVCISIYIVIFTTPGLYVFPGQQVCGANFENSAALVKWIIGARMALLVADALVLALTWLKTYRLRNADRMLETTTLSAALFTGSGVYFSLLCIANVIAIAIASINTLIFPMNAWLAVLTSVLLSRLLFQLREVSSTDSSKDNTTSTAVSSTIVFQDSPAIRMRVLSHCTIEVDDGGYVTDECDV